MRFTLTALLDREPPVPSGDGKAGDQPLQIPFPGPRNGLVEIVDVEYQAPLRCPEATEVQQVSVPTTLHRDARAVGSGQVRRHDQSCAAKNVNGDTAMRP